MSEEIVQEDVRPIAGIGTLVFGKYDVRVTCEDQGLQDTSVTTVGTPHRRKTHQIHGLEIQVVCR